MTRKILLTSFQTWLPHQKSNASDDLLASIETQPFPFASLTFLRQLPVETSQASRRVIGKIQELQPDVILCCGMAERNIKLALESNARCADAKLTTSVNLEQLIIELAFSETSHDAGQFVCEGLYYEVLKFLSDVGSKSHCLFIHVPILTPKNELAIRQDLLTILEKLALS